MVKLFPPYNDMPRYSYKGYTILLDLRHPKTIHIVCNLTRKAKDNEDYPGMESIHNTLTEAKMWCDKHPLTIPNEEGERTSIFCTCNPTPGNHHLTGHHHNTDCAYYEEDIAAW